MAKGIKGTGSNTTTLFTMNIEKAVKDEFHIWAIRNNTTMTDTLMAFIMQLIDKQIPNPIVDPKRLKKEDGVEAVAKFFDEVNKSDSWEDTY